MQKPPQDQLRELLSLLRRDQSIDNQTAIRMKKQLAEDFRRQLSFGAPNNEDEKGLRRLSKRLKEQKVIVKLFLRHPLHAKLYLLFRSDPINPVYGYQLVYWKKRFLKTETAVSFVPLELEHLLDIPCRPDRAPLCLVVNNHFKIEISAGFDPQLLRQLIFALQAPA